MKSPSGEPLVLVGSGAPPDPEMAARDTLFQLDPDAAPYETLADRLRRVKAKLRRPVLPLVFPRDDPRQEAVGPAPYGDHAPWMQTGAGKFKILNAYYLPGHNDLLYPTISPVNTFRLILDTYLGADYPLLNDTSYYSPIPNIYEFQETPNPCLDP